MFTVRWLDNDDDLNNALLAGFSSLLSLAFSFILSLGVFNWGIQKVPEKTDSNKFRFYHSLVWTLFGVVAPLTLLVLLTDVISVSWWCLSESGCSPVDKMKFLFFALLLTTVVFSIYCYMRLITYNVMYNGKSHSQTTTMEKTLYYYFKFTEDQKRFFTFNCGDISGWNVFCRCKCRNTLAQCLKYGSLLFPTVFVFLALLFHYILPVILLLTVYPWKISSAYIFLFSALLLYSLVSIYSSYNVLRLKTRSEEIKDCIICLYSCLPILTLIFMMIPLYLFFVLYAALSSGGLSSTLFYFSPSLLLSVASWCMYQVQRKFSEESKKENLQKEHNSELQKTPDKNTKSVENDLIDFFTSPAKIQHV